MEIGTSLKIDFFKKFQTDFHDTGFAVFFDQITKLLNLI